VSDDNSSSMNSRIMEMGDEEELSLEEEYLGYEEEVDEAEVEVTNQNRVQLNLTDETDGSIENNRVEYAILLPNSFTILDSTFDDQNSLL
jgi:hypothetical protein